MTLDMSIRDIRPLGTVLPTTTQRMIAAELAILQRLHTCPVRLYFRHWGDSPNTSRIFSSTTRKKLAPINSEGETRKFEQKMLRL